jgi:ATP synthase protein I
MSFPQGPDSQRDWQMVGLASGLGCSVVASLLVCIGAGILIDRWLGTDPFGVLIGMVLGLVAAGYSFYELIAVSNRRRTTPNKRRAGGENGKSPPT